MLRHHVFGLTENVIRPTLIRLPGYPLFLALCFLLTGGVHYTPVLWVQIAVDLGTCVLIAALAARLCGRRVGRLALWFGALCPFTANYTAAALAEPLSLFCVALSFYALERWTAQQRASKPGWIWVFCIGAALAYAVLLRPDQGLLAAAVIPAMIWIGWKGGPGSIVSRLTPAALASLIVVLPLALWGMRNWRVFHVVQPLAPRYATDPDELVSYGFQRWYRTWGVELKSTYDVYWIYDGSPLSMSDLPPRAFDSPGQRAETAKVIAAYNEVSSATPAIDARFAALAAERVRAHPLRYYVVMPMARLVNMWFRPRTEMLKLPLDWWRFRAHLWGSLTAFGFGLLNLAYVVLAVIGAWRWRSAGWSGQRVLAWSMLGFLVLRSAMLLTVDNSEPRYTLECFPVVILLASFAFLRRDEIVRG
jgi:4-amino-4-deoxy-L-arabinose transferase-like glycosyltransferase